MDFHALQEWGAQDRICQLEEQVRNLQRDARRAEEARLAAEARAEQAERTVKAENSLRRVRVVVVGSGLSGSLLRWLCESSDVVLDVPTSVRAIVRSDDASPKWYEAPSEAYAHDQHAPHVLFHACEFYGRNHEDVQHFLLKPGAIIVFLVDLYQLNCNFDKEVKSTLESLERLRREFASDPIILLGTNADRVARAAADDVLKYLEAAIVNSHSSIRLLHQPVRSNGITLRDPHLIMALEQENREGLRTVLAALAELHPPFNLYPGYLDGFKDLCSRKRADQLLDESLQIATARLLDHEKWMTALHENSLLFWLPGARISLKSEEGIVIIARLVFCRPEHVARRPPPPETRDSIHKLFPSHDINFVCAVLVHFELAFQPTSYETFQIPYLRKEMLDEGNDSRRSWVMVKFLLGMKLTLLARSSLVVRTLKALAPTVVVQEFCADGCLFKYREWKALLAFVFEASTQQMMARLIIQPPNCMGDAPKLWRSTVPVLLDMVATAISPFCHVLTATVRCTRCTTTFEYPLRSQVLLHPLCASCEHKGSAEAVLKSAIRKGRPRIMEAFIVGAMGPTILTHMHKFPDSQAQRIKSIFWQGNREHAFHEFCSILEISNMELLEQFLSAWQSVVATNLLLELVAAEDEIAISRSYQRPPIPSDN